MNIHEKLFELRDDELVSISSKEKKKLLKLCPNYYKTSELEKLITGNPTLENAFEKYDVILSPVSCVAAIENQNDRNTRGPEGPSLDISPIGNMKDLEYLEICKSNIADISPLANCTKLVDLNLGTNHISDLTPLYGLKSLRRLFICGCNSYGGRPFPEDKVEELRAHIPDCDVNNDTVNLGGTWRQHPHYETLASMFSYQLDKPQAYEPFTDVE